MHKTSFIASEKVVLLLRRLEAAPEDRREGFNQGAASVLYYTQRTGAHTEPVWTGVCCSCRLSKFLMPKVIFLSLENKYFFVSLGLTLVFLITLADTNRFQSC